MASSEGASARAGYLREKLKRKSFGTGNFTYPLEGPKDSRDEWELTTEAGHHHSAFGCFTISQLGGYLP
jgi:hypothetical protein